MKGRASSSFFSRRHFPGSARLGSARLTKTNVAAGWRECAKRWIREGLNGLTDSRASRVIMRASRHSLTNDWSPARCNSRRTAAWLSRNRIDTGRHLRQSDATFVENYQALAAECFCQAWRSPSSLMVCPLLPLERMLDRRFANFAKIPFNTSITSSNEKPERPLRLQRNRTLQPGVKCFPPPLPFHPQARLGERVLQAG